MRGIGVPWGIAEEAGKSVRWLEGRGFPGVVQMVAHLSVIDGKDYHGFCPQSVEAPLMARVDALCAIAAGIAMADTAEEWVQTGALDIGPVLHPLLLLPFVASAAKLTATPIRMSWEEARFDIMPDGCVIATKGPFSDRVEWARVEPCAAQDVAQTVSRPLQVDADCWAKLDAFGHRIFAPNTEHSRTAGAGGADD